MTHKEGVGARYGCCAKLVCAHNEVIAREERGVSAKHAQLYWQSAEVALWRAMMEPTLTGTQARGTRKSLRGGVGSGAVRGESVLVGVLKGCYWWKTVWRTRELHCYIQTENIKQWRVACSECTCTVYCGCCDNVLHWITLNSSEYMKAYCLLFVQWLWNKCFKDG
jgi:hypothetical protein